MFRHDLDVLYFTTHPLFGRKKALFFNKNECGKGFENGVAANLLRPV
jgi:hypothetical protein